MKTLEKALGAGTPFEIGGRTWLVKPLTTADYVELARHVAMMIPPGTEAPENPLDAFDKSDSGNMITVIWLMLRRADPSLTPVRRANHWYTLTKDDTEALLEAHFKAGGSFDVIGELLAASGIFPDAEEVAAAEADSKNDEAPGGAAPSESKPSRRQSRRAAHSSSSGADIQPSAS